MVFIPDPESSLSCDTLIRPSVVLINKKLVAVRCFVFFFFERENRNTISGKD